MVNETYTDRYVVPPSTGESQRTSRAAGIQINIVITECKMLLLFIYSFNLIR